MNALQMLRDDHAKVKRLFAQFESTESDQVRKRLADEIVRELSIHAAIEEQLFYPAIRVQLPDLEEKVLEALEEHAVAKWELLSIQRMKPSDERFDAKMSVLMESVRHHIEEEEGELFPRVREIMGTDGLDLLGNLLKDAKAISPTRPHPRAPDEPPGNLVAGPLAAILDASKDFVKGIRERPRAASPRRGRVSKGKGRR